VFSALAITKSIEKLFKLFEVVVLEPSTAIGTEKAVSQQCRESPFCFGGFDRNNLKIQTFVGN
jgi:hypothetical protein